MRTLSAGVTAAQQSKSSTPYVKVELTRGETSHTFTSADSPNRVRFIKHTEEPFNSNAIIVVENSNRDLPTNLCGFKCEISYGYVISGTPDITGGKTAPLWVKMVTNTSKMGSLDGLIYCEGAWNMLAEIEDIASIILSGAGSAPYYNVDYSGSEYTLYDIMEDVLAAAGFDLKALDDSDSIVDVLQPSFGVNNLPFENAAHILYRALMCTKQFLRVETPAASDLADFRLLHPDGYESFDYTYTSDGE